MTTNFPQSQMPVGSFAPAVATNVAAPDLAVSVPTTNRWLGGIGSPFCASGVHTTKRISPGRLRAGLT